MTAEPAPDRPLLPGRARPIKAGFPRETALPDYLPARMLNEYVYCPRLFFYEWVEGVFAHSGDTVEGALRHEKLGEKEEALPEPDAAGKERIHSRSVMLSSDAHRLIARIDVVEGDADAVVPVDYKRGEPRATDDGPQAWPADRAQVCAQALILRDNGYRCDEAVVYYSATKQRVRVQVDEALVAETLAALDAARRVATIGRIPPPLTDSPKCPRCSLVGICLPDETAFSVGREGSEGATQLSLFADEAGGLGPGPAAPRGADSEVRRLVPARDDLRPLYVTGYGLTIGKSGEVLQIRDGKSKKMVQEARLMEISQVNVFGSNQVTAAAVQGLCDGEKPVAYFSSGGWFYGMTLGLGLKNVFLRQEQFRRADDEGFCLLLARDIVSTKIRNQRTLLQRNHVEPPADMLARLKQLAEQAQRAGAADSLLGIEGTAARLYFEHFAGMLKVEDDDGMQVFEFAHRNRRPPRDPVNALLSLAYSLLVRDLTIVCHGIGFDPFVGFYHQPRFGRPALALDLMEGFRPLVADSSVLSAVNTRMVTTDDFVRAGRAVALTSKGRKGFLRAYEQRMDMLVTHPLFGYRVSYRRVLEIQARLLARLVGGELSRYPGFETR